VMLARTEKVSANVNLSLQEIDTMCRWLPLHYKSHSKTTQIESLSTDTTPITLSIK